MDIPPVITQLRYLRRQPVAPSARWVVFEQFGAALIAGSPLISDDAAAARLEETSRLCRQAALQREGSSWYVGVVDSWPAAIAHELHALAACLAGHGRARLLPEAALLMEQPPLVQCLGTGAENYRGYGKIAAGEPTWS